MLKLFLHVSDMHCPNCVMTLEELEINLEGVNSVRASYQKQSVEIMYDEAQLDSERILTEIRSLGYSPQIV